VGVRTLKGAREVRTEEGAMNCYYHPDREIAGMCVSCGKPICFECKVVLKNKLYCNPCIDDGKARVVYETGSWAWWLLPTTLGVVGGLIAYLAVKSKNPIRSTDYLIVGTIITLWYIGITALD